MLTRRLPDATPSSDAFPGRGAGWAGLLCAAALAAAAIAAYSHTFAVPLLYDDTPTIAGNPTLRHWGSVLAPPNDTTAGGRPVLNLSFAINYAIGGTSVWGYHAVNLAIHVAAGLALFGIARRTLARGAGRAALAVAFSTSLLWLVHPLQTEAVTYIVQRAESLMGLFYLLTLYCFIRGAEAAGRLTPLWFLLCVACCALGMGTKEVMVSAPLIVLLYDRTFAAGSFREALRRRMRVHAALAATWLLLAFLVLSSHGRGGTAGSGTGVEWWRYGLTQFQGIAHYLRLCLWPHPLVFDYGTALARPSLGLLPCASLVVVLMAATLWALARRPAVGFLGACFFAILAPSSSIVPVATETLAEHRMYLPLAAVLALSVVLAHRWMRRAALPLCLVLAAGLSVATWRRNEAYRDAVTLWQDTAVACPQNERAHANLGAAWLERPGHVTDAIAEYEEALRLMPGDAEIRNDLGSIYLRLPGRRDDAIAQYEEALRLRPGYFEVRNNLGNALSGVPGRLGDAIAQYEEALRLKPGDAGVHINLGSALSRVPGRLGDAIAQYEEALRLEPDNADAHNNLGNALSGVPGRLGDAIAQYGEALRLEPGDAEVHGNLGYALSRAPGRLSEAVKEYEEALRLNPGYARAHRNLGVALSGMPGRLGDAIAEYGAALRLDPNDAETHFNLGNAWMGLPGHGADAIAQYEEALRLNPGHAQAHNNLGYALSGMPGRLDEAVAHYEAALRLSPDYAKAHLNLGIALATAPGRLDDAVVQLEEALRLGPDAAETRFRLAEALLREPGRRDEARAQLEAGLRLEPENDAARRLLRSLGDNTP
jgi:tetratricopeptide (TPR) repeat protein